MSIKNWTVTTQRIKNKSEGLSEYTSYLVSLKHENHKNTQILQIFSMDYNRFLNNTINETIEFDSKNKKGGRKVESYAQSFNFILPPPHKPTPEQWKKIGIDLVNTIHKELNIKSEVNNFGNACFINVHDQANPHLNMLVPRIFQGERLADLDRKNVLAKLKLQFNQSVMKHCEIDHTHHNPLRVNTGRRKNKQRYEHSRALEAAESASKATVEAQEAQKSATVIIKELEVKELQLDKEKLQLEKDKEKLSFFIRTFRKVKQDLMNWYNSVKEDLYLETMVNRQELEESANSIIKNNEINDEDALLVETVVSDFVEKLDKEHENLIKPEISSRRTKLKA